MSRIPPVTLAAFVLASAAQAQVPAGPEFRVNTYTTAAQTRADAAARADGSFVVVWDGFTAGGSGYDVIARRFDAAGVPLGSELVVNSTIFGNQAIAAVGMGRRGQFVVAWQANTDIIARQFSPAGVAQGAEFTVNGYTTGIQSAPAVLVQPNGAFVVTWQSNGQDGDGYGVFGRRFDAFGTPLGSDFQVNSYTTAQQRRPRLAAQPGGGFVVVFDGPDDFAQGIFARRFDGAGVPFGTEQQVNTALATQFIADVAADGLGGFVVTWASYAQDGGHNGVYARRFDPAGAPVGGEFRANVYTTAAQDQPRIDMDAAGRFVIAWESYTQDQGTVGVWARRYDAAGVPRGGEFQVNTYTSGTQNRPVAVVDAVGNVVAAWDSGGQDGSGSGIYAQRLGGLRPSALAVVDGGNNVLELPDDFVLTTSWRNVSGAPQTFSGQGIDFTGPAGLVYVMGSTTANYGTVPAGASQACSGSCLSGSLLGTRPAGHVDVFFRERIVPDTQGQEQRWVLHVGDSFSDVARTNPFYRFVETLLHHAVTGGCTAAQYCPASSTTREQMAVFVLVGKEGAGYAPPACSPPNLFADVPETSGFCRWIEELANRGVVAGCGGGNYCPAQPVTRAQMAVFVLRTLDPTFTPPPCSTPQFPDVPPTDPFCPWIEELARRGVVTGCGGGNYCPSLPVTREQMGVFICATFGLTLYGV